MKDSFTEGFEIVVSTLDEEDYDWEKEEYRPKYIEAAVNTLAELGISKDEVTYERTGVGVGAAGDAIALIMLAGISVLMVGKRVFLAGKTINENVDAWIELAKKLRRVLTKLKAAYVSQPFAAALALEEIIKKDPNARAFDLEGAFIEIVLNPSMDTTGLLSTMDDPFKRSSDTSRCVTAYSSFGLLPLSTQSVCAQLARLNFITFYQLTTG